MKNQKSLGELFAGTTCQIAREQMQVFITGVSNDSRRIRPGDLFFAVPGFSVDGRKFIPEAISLGARAIVTETAIEGLEGIPQIICPEIRKTMSKVAACFYGFPSTLLPVVGVTGTNGKTTTTYMFAHIMARYGKKWGRFGTVEYFTGGRTLNAINTTPDSLELQSLLDETRQNGLAGCVMEVSSHGLALGRCDDIEFAGAVFTNLTQDHLDYHKDMESYFKAKSILFKQLLKKDGFAVLNAADPYSSRLAKFCPGKVITFAVNGSSGIETKAELRLIDLGYFANRRSFEANYSGRSISGSMPYLGKFNLQNAAASIGAALGMGLSLAQAVEPLADAPQVPGRAQKIEAGQPFEVVVDYAHTPDALENLLQGIETDGMKILVFGCGGDRDRTKRPIMGEIAGRMANQVIVTSDNPRTENPAKIITDILHGMPKGDHIKIVENRDEAIGQALGMAGAGDLVIIAGKGHEDYQIFGKTKVYFSDQDAIKKYLKKMGYAAS